MLVAPGFRRRFLCLFAASADGRRQLSVASDETLVQIRGGFVIAVVGRRAGEQAGESRLQFAQVDTVLRTLGPRQARRYGRKIQRQFLAVVDVACLGHAVQSLRLEVCGERADFLVGAACSLEIFDGGVVDRKKAHRRAVLGCHVADGGAIGNGETGRAFAEKLDEFAHHFLLTQHFRDRQHQVGGGDAFAQLALKIDPDHIGRQKIDWLSQHSGLGFDAADAPGNHADAIDHGGVRIGADQRVGIIDTAFFMHATREVFEVYLVHDAHARRHDLERVEGLHAPLHELIAFLVALEFQFHVQVECILRAIVVDLHRVVDDEIDRDQRFDDFRVLAHPGRDAAHGGKVGEQRHAGEILQYDTCNDEGNFRRSRSVRRPRGELPDVFFGNFLTVEIAQHRFKHYADRNRQTRDLADAGFLQRGQGVELALLAGAGRELVERIEQAVGHGGISRKKFVSLRRGRAAAR